MSKFSINNPAFLQMACVKSVQDNLIVLNYPAELLEFISSIGLASDSQVIIESIKNGEQIVETYESLPGESVEDCTLVDFQSDPDTDIKIIGDVKFCSGFFLASDKCKIKSSSLTQLMFSTSSLFVNPIKNLELLVVQHPNGLIPLMDLSGFPLLNAILYGITIPADGVTEKIIINNSNLEMFGSLNFFNSLEIQNAPSLKQLGSVTIKESSSSFNGVTINDEIIGLDKIPNIESLAIICPLYDIPLDSMPLLKSFGLQSNNIESLVFDNSENIEQIYLRECENLKLLDFSQCENLTGIRLSLSGLETLHVNATNELVANQIANSINNTSIPACTIYLRNGDAYNSIISDAATAKGGFNIEYV